MSSTWKLLTVGPGGGGGVLTAVFELASTCCTIGCSCRAACTTGGMGLGSIGLGGEAVPAFPTALVTWKIRVLSVYPVFGSVTVTVDGGSNLAGGVTAIIVGGVVGPVAVGRVVVVVPDISSSKLL